MRSAPPLLLLVACAPKIDPGPAPVVEAAAPVEVLELPDASSPNLYLQAIVAAGSAYDPVGREGLAHLAASALIDAGAGERSSQEVRDLLYPTGNALELVVDREWVSLRLRCHRDHAERCLEVFADALTAPRFDTADLSRLRDTAVHAVTDALLADEEALGAEVLESVLYEGHPYGHPVPGRASVIPLLSDEEVERFYREHYVREAMLVGIAGDFAPEHVAALRERLEAVPGERMPELRPFAPPEVEGRSLVVVDTSTDVTGFHFGHPLQLDRNHEDWPELMVAMTAFGAHRQSFGRLFNVLRTDRGLNYGDYAYVEPYVQRGWSPLPENGVLRRANHFYVWIRPTSLENGPFALKLAVDEVERLVEEGLTEQEMADVTAYLAGAVPLLAQDPGRRLAYALDAAASGTPSYLEALPAALDAMTREEVNDALARHLRPDDLRIVAVSGEAEALRDRLLEESPTPIVYADVEPDEAQARRDAEVASKELHLDPEDVWIVEAEGIFR